MGQARGNRAELGRRAVASPLCVHRCLVRPTTCGTAECCGEHDDALGSTWCGGPLSCQMREVPTAAPAASLNSVSPPCVQCLARLACEEIPRKDLTCRCLLFFFGIAAAAASAAAAATSDYCARSQKTPAGSDAVHCAYRTFNVQFYGGALPFRTPLRAASTSLVTDNCSASSASGACLLRPSTWPMSPPGFGTGHSLFGIDHSPPPLVFLLPSRSMSLHVSSWQCRRRLLVGRGSPDSADGSGESARARGSTGQGSKWGVATTRNETMRVVVKRDVVMRDRGWRCGGMMDRGGCSYRGITGRASRALPLGGWTRTVQLRRPEKTGSEGSSGGCWDGGGRGEGWGSSSLGRRHGWPAKPR